MRYTEKSKFPVTDGDPGTGQRWRIGGCVWLSACDYCQQPIGDLHLQDCVCVCRDSTYDVLLQSDGRRIGSYTRLDPSSWDDETCDSHKNDSSWCAENADGASGYTGEPLPDAEAAGVACLCHLIKFKLVFRSAEERLY